MSDTTQDVAEKKKQEYEPFGSSLAQMATGISIPPPPYSEEIGAFMQDGWDFTKDQITSGSQWTVSNTVGAPSYQFNNDGPTTSADTVSGMFANQNTAVPTQSGMVANEPEFDSATIRDSIRSAEFRGAGSDQLENAMMTLYTNPSGAELDRALLQIKEARGMTDLSLEDLRDQYNRAMEIKKAGEEHAAENGHDNVSPGFDPADLAEGGRHEGFSGSTTQLRFGMILGDTFDIDPVFGSLISPTGGAVGPGADSVSNADKNNPAVMHGVVHDAAGYLLNAHGLGPGYNYLGAGYELASENPLSGQVSGMAYMTERNPLLNTLAIGGTFLKNIPWYGLSGDNFVQSGVEVGSGNSISRGIDTASNAVSDGIGWLGDQASGLYEGAKGLAGDAWEGVKGFGSSVMDKGKSMYEGAKGLAGDAWQGAQNMYGNAKEGISGLASDAWSGATGMFDSAVSGAKNIGSSVLNKGKEAVEGAKNLGSDAWEQAKQLGHSAWDTADSFGSSAFDQVSGLASEAWSNTKSTGQKAMSSAKDLGKGVVESAESLVSSTGNAVGDAFESSKEFVSGAFQKLGW